MYPHSKLQVYKCKYFPGIERSTRLIPGQFEPDSIMIFSFGIQDSSKRWIDYNDLDKFVKLVGISRNINADDFIKITEYCNNSKIERISDKYKWDGKVRVKIEDWDNYIKYKYDDR